ncbi:MAG: hypothetical protein ACJ72A_25090 [Nocardioidaceae bacterium]
MTATVPGGPPATTAVDPTAVGLTIRFLPGRGGASPADGFHAAGPPAVAALPGILVAATAGLALGAVIGPEAPLIALGAGVSAWALRRPVAGAVLTHGE